MNRENIVLTVKDKQDINMLKNNNIKYLNIDIVNVDSEIIDYLKENGGKYLYAESINNRGGYIYVDYNTFFLGEKIINSIISNIPKNLKEIEKAKYLYITLGKFVGYDINTMPEKNETFNFGEVNTINNIWGAICNLKATNQSYCKIYMYLCSLIGIKCDIVSVNNKGFLCNKLTIDNNCLIVDLTGDVPFIQAGFKTRFFSNYNDEIELDKKIGYIKDNYSEIKIDKILKRLNTDNDGFVLDFLVNTQKLISADKMKPIELGIIYDMLFHKYCPNVKIFINNLYINDNCNNKEHFILISYNEIYYIYNYNKKTFMKICEHELRNNIINEKIGIYLNENMSIKYKYKEVV